MKFVSSKNIRSLKSVRSRKSLFPTDIYYSTMHHTKNCCCCCSLTSICCCITTTNVHKFVKIRTCKPKTLKDESSQNQKVRMLICSYDIKFVCKNIRRWQIIFWEMFVPVKIRSISFYKFSCALIRMSIFVRWE